MNELETTNEVCESNPKLAPFKDIISRLEGLIKSGKNTPVFVYNDRFKSVIAPIWNTFASSFTDNVLFQSDIDQINYTPVSSDEHFTMFIHKLQDSTKEVAITQILSAFKRAVL